MIINWAGKLAICLLVLLGLAAIPISDDKKHGLKASYPNLPNLINEFSLDKTVSYGELAFIDLCSSINQCVKEVEAN